MAQAEGPITIYLELPREDQERWVTLLEGIGYWGRTDSFASCLQVDASAPSLHECVRSLDGVSNQSILTNFFSCVLTEFRDPQLSWYDIVPFEEPLAKKGKNPLKLGIYIWPLSIVRQRNQNLLLMRSSFSE
jgi:hypothetical protein